MIGSAGLAIKSVEQQLEALGLLLVEDRDYSATFASPTHTLRIARDPHDAGFSASLKNACGETFEFGLLAESIAPQWYAEFQFRSRARQAIEGRETSELADITHFLETHSAKVFELPASFSAAYQERSRLRWAKLGLLKKI